MCIDHNDKTTESSFIPGWSKTREVFHWWDYPGEIVEGYIPKTFNKEKEENVGLNNFAKG